MVANYFDPILYFNNHALNILENNNNKSNIMVCCELLETAVALISKNNDDEESMSSSFVVSQEQRQDNEKEESLCYNFQWSKSFSCKTNADFKTFIFSKGLKILLDNHHSGLSKLNHDCKAAIFYNAGLVLHLMAYVSNDSWYLIRAKQMYCSSQAILRNTFETRENDGSIPLICLQNYLHIALLNNLGQISYELAEFDATEHYFHHLNLNLNHFVPKAQRLIVKEEGMIDTTDFAGMVSNTMLDIPIMAPTA